MWCLSFSNEPKQNMSHRMCNITYMIPVAFQKAWAGKAWRWGTMGKQQRVMRVRHLSMTQTHCKTHCMRPHIILTNLRFASVWHANKTDQTQPVKTSAMSSVIETSNLWQKACVTNQGHGVWKTWTITEQGKSTGKILFAASWKCRVECFRSLSHIKD